MTALIYAAGVLAAFGYTQTMVRAAQKVLFDIRRDLFAHLQTLPLRFFDSRRHGDTMSYFTNDVDTVSDALNNSFAMVIQSLIQMVGILVLLFILNWRLSLLVVLGYAAMFLYIHASGRRSKAGFSRQQECLGDLDGYIEELVNGQKVVKVFRHEEENLRIFRKKNERLRRAGTSAQSYAATMIPAVVSISYVNYALVAVLGGIMRSAAPPTSAAWSAIWFLSARRHCRSTSSRSRAISCWRLWPAPSGSSRPCARLQNATREKSSWSMSGKTAAHGSPARKKPAPGPGRNPTGP